MTASIVLSHKPSATITTADIDRELQSPLHADTSRQQPP